MKKLFLALPLLIFSGQIYASTLTLEETLQVEITKDINGEPSCFKGKVKDYKTTMEENYGGRYNGNHSLAVQTLSETTFRSYTKYCDRYLDADMNEIATDDIESLPVYKQCINTDNNKSIATITFGSSSSGTFETEGLAYLINFDTTHDLIVDINSPGNPESENEEEIKSSNVSHVLNCRLIEL